MVRLEELGQQNLDELMFTGMRLSTVGDLTGAPGSPFSPFSQFLARNSMVRQSSRTKAFRKTDITAVEESLHQASIEKTVTGSIIAAAPDADLFVVDTMGASDGLAKEGAFKKGLRLDEIVRPKSKIEVARQKVQGKVDAALIKKRLQAALKAAPKPSSTPTKPIGTKQIQDPWADDAPAVISKIKPERESRAKAVIVPLAGASYNPDPASHAALMEAAAAQEIARVERLERAKAAVHVPLAERPDTINYDESTGMVYEDIFGPAEDEEEAEDVEASTSGSYSAIPSAMSKKERKEKETKKQERLNRQLEAQALHAKTILRRVQEDRLQAKERSAALAKSKASKTGRKLGPIRFAPGMIEVKLPEELEEAGSLRRMKPEGNAVEARFKALQEQAKIEPRVRRAGGRRRYALKSYEKHSYKSFI